MHQSRRGNMSDHYISLLNIEHFVSIFGSIFNLSFWGSFPINLWKGHSYQLNRTHGWFFLIFLPSLMLFYCFEWKKKSFNGNIYLFISTCFEQELVKSKSILDLCMYIYKILIFECDWTCKWNNFFCRIDRMLLAIYYLVIFGLKTTHKKCLVMA